MNEIDHLIHQAAIFQQNGLRHLLIAQFKPQLGQRVGDFKLATDDLNFDALCLLRGFFVLQIERVTPLKLLHQADGNVGHRIFIELEAVDGQTGDAHFEFGIH